MSVRLSLLGGARIEIDGSVVRGRAAQRRRVALLALLALAPRRALTRERVIAHLWPEYPTDSARRLLSESLYVIRRDLGEAIVKSFGEELVLDPAVTCDADDFRRAAEAGDAGSALALYHGPLLDAWFVRDAPEFERWVETERTRLADLHARLLRCCAEQQESEGHWRAAAEFWQAIAQVDPYSAVAAWHAARALGLAGERAAALQLLAAHEALVHADLGVGLAPELVELKARLRDSGGQSLDTLRPYGSPATRGLSRPAVPPAGVGARLDTPSGSTSTTPAAADLTVKSGSQADAPNLSGQLRGRGAPPPGTPGEDPASAAATRDQSSAQPPPDSGVATPGRSPIAPASPDVAAVPQGLGAGVNESERTQRAVRQRAARLPRVIAVAGVLILGSVSGFVYWRQNREPTTIHEAIQRELFKDARVVRSGPIVVLTPINVTGRRELDSLSWRFGSVLYERLRLVRGGNVLPRHVVTRLERSTTDDLIRRGGARIAGRVMDSAKAQIAIAPLYYLSGDSLRLQIAMHRRVPFKLSRAELRRIPEPHRSRMSGTAKAIESAEIVAVAGPVSDPSAAFDTAAAAVHRAVLSMLSCDPAHHIDDGLPPWCWGDGEPIMVQGVYRARVERDRTRRSSTAPL